LIGLERTTFGNLATRTLEQLGDLLGDNSEVSLLTLGVLSSGTKIFGAKGVMSTGITVLGPDDNLLSGGHILAMSRYFVVALATGILKV